MINKPCDITDCASCVQRPRGRLRALSLLLVIATSITSLSLRSALHCPGQPSGPAQWVQPTIFCDPEHPNLKHPECSINVLDGGKHMGPCVWAEEPAHCEDGYGVVSAKEYWGKCVAPFHCGYVIGEDGQHVYIEDNHAQTTWSRAYPLGCQG